MVRAHNFLSSLTLCRASGTSSIWNVCLCEPLSSSEVITHELCYLFQQFLWQFLLWFIDTFPKWCFFCNFITIFNLQKDISSSLFQWFIASAETNNTSKGRSDTQIFGAGKFKGVPSSGGLHAYFLKKGIEQKVNLMEQSQDSEIYFFVVPILFLHDEESSLSSNLNSKLLRFHCVRPILASTVHDGQIQ